MGRFDLRPAIPLEGRGYATIGGSAVDGTQTTTHWSEIQAARTTTPEHRKALLNTLAGRYWKPVFSYLRAKGYQDADARDITQDFFNEVVLGRDLFGRAVPERGRFRAYLLHCLKTFARQRHRREHAQRRAPDRGLISIEEWGGADKSRYHPPARDMSPEAVFHQQWATSLFELVLQRLRLACRQNGLEVHLSIFEQRFVAPALEQSAPVPLESLAHRYGLTPKQVANRTETVRRRFRKLFLDEVRATVSDEASASEEVGSLIEQLRLRPEQSSRESE
ncbi:MAG: sigma-70 family RNA polymerase sigma factor [Phycisphaerales bacterium]|nr:MAG: sigma-70 family RNA polymerase sigma factor [Phycisphaerales bacterium]